jgi:tetratricopeptide (TPR) repeat protein
MALRPILDSAEMAEILNDPAKLREAAAVALKTLPILPLLEREGGGADLARPFRNTADTLLAANKLEEAEAVYRRSLLLFEKHSGAASPLLVPVLNNLAVLLDITDRRDEARQLLSRARTILQQSRTGSSEHGQVVEENWQQTEGAGESSSSRSQLFPTGTVKDWALQALGYAQDAARNRDSGYEERLQNMCLVEPAAARFALNSFATMFRMKATGRSVAEETDPIASILRAQLCAMLDVYVKCQEFLGQARADTIQELRSLEEYATITAAHQYLQRVSFPDIAASALKA